MYWLTNDWNQFTENKSVNMTWISSSYNWTELRLIWAEALDKWWTSAIHTRTSQSAAWRSQRQRKLGQQSFTSLRCHVLFFHSWLWTGSWDCSSFPSHAPLTSANRRPSLWSGHPSPTLMWRLPPSPCAVKQRHCSMQLEDSDTLSSVCSKWNYGHRSYSRPSLQIYSGE